MRQTLILTDVILILSSVIKIIINVQIPLNLRAKNLGNLIFYCIISLLTQYFIKPLDNAMIKIKPNDSIQLFKITFDYKYLLLL